MRISDWSSDVCSSDLPLLAAAIVLPHGQRSVAWFSLAALVAIVVLWRIGTWYRQQHHAAAAKPKPVLTSGLPRRTVIRAMVVLMLLVFSRSEEHTSELQSLMRISYAVFCLKKKK